MEGKVDLQDLDYLSQAISAASRIVFFGGAGVSTESGIPDFRSQDGLYSKKFKHSPEYMLSHNFFVSDPQGFYEFYRSEIFFTNFQPNFAHEYLKRLEDDGKLSAVITQNIDGLHQKGGSSTVYELHGSIYRYFCTKCNNKFGADLIENSTGIPLCDCGGIVKPDVVLYGEGLDDVVVNGAVQAIRGADLLIVAGTSLTVYPAAQMIQYRNKNCRLILINKTPTSYDLYADKLYKMPVGELFKLVSDINHD